MKHSYKASIMATLALFMAAASGFASGPEYGATAAAAGVDAEISNIAMYKAFLSRLELSKPENASARTLFEQLMRASQNHLRAFKTQLSKY